MVPVIVIVGCLAGNFVGLGFLQSVSFVKSIPTPEKLFAVGKNGPIATFNLFFLGLGYLGLRNWSVS